MRDYAALLKELKAFDEEYFARHGDIAGMDEAGRGPLFGPVVAACVMLPQDWGLEGVYDSKKVTEKRRLEFAGRIKEASLCYGIGMASAAEIDEYNIAEATKLAMKRAAEHMGRVPGCYILDYIKDFQLSAPTYALEKGDAKSFSIACASILAKTERDAMMEEYAEMYPEYLLEKHKGYPTKEHYAAIFRHGVTEQHRRRFLRNLSSHAT